MFKFLRKLRQKKNDADIKAGEFIAIDIILITIYDIKSEHKKRLSNCSAFFIKMFLIK